MNAVVSGALGGFLATVPMTAVMSSGFRRLPKKDQQPLPPREITMMVAERAQVKPLLSKSLRTRLTLIGHFLYGAAAGVPFALVRRGQKGAGSGLFYGLLVWAGSYLGWLPVVGLHAPATRESWWRNLLMITAHLVWGASLAAIVRGLQGRVGREPAGFASASS